MTCTWKLLNACKCFIPTAGNFPWSYEEEPAEAEAPAGAEAPAEAEAADANGNGAHATV